MKLILRMLSLLTGAFYALAQPAPDTLWIRAFGSAAVEWGYGVAATSDGDHLFTGMKANATTDIMVVRADAAGAQLWSRSYDSGFGTDVGRAITSTLSGDIIVAANRSTQLSVLALNGLGDSLWARTITSPASTEASAILADEDGTIVVAGTAHNAGGIGDDFFVARLTAAGDTMWTAVYDYGEHERTRAIARTADGYILTGTTTPVGSSFSDVGVLRIGSGGGEFWYRTIGDPAQSEIAVGIGSVGEDFLLGGQTTVSGAATNLRAWRLDRTGAVTWTRTYNTALAEIAGGATITTDQGIAIGGYQSSAAEGFNVFMIKYTLSGILAWTKLLGGSQNDFCEGVTSTNDGGLAAVGMTRSFGNGETDFYCIRLAGLSGVTGFLTNRNNGFPLSGVSVSALGQLTTVVSDVQGRYTLAIPPGLATVIIGGHCIEPDSIPNVEVIQDSFRTLNMTVLLTDLVFDQSSINMVVPNHSRASEPLQISNPGTGALYFTILPRALQPSGNWLSVSPSIGVLNPGMAMEVLVTVAADTADIGVFDFQGDLTFLVNSCPDSLWLVNVQAAVVNAADSRMAPLPDELTLSAFPNPFNPQTTIEFSLPEASNVQLAIFDLAGRRVRTLSDDQHFPAGNHRLMFDGATLPSGIYISRLESGAVQLTQKLLLLK